MPPATPRAVGAGSSPSSTIPDQEHVVGIEIAIHSDVCCPWCWIGRRRLAVALAALPKGLATISWHPFRLNPDLPPAGMPRDVYRRRKFGSDA
jgi:predicted DsbA family dithiol-disulfide isomerase